jgi:hypothetical protein
VLDAAAYFIQAAPIKVSRPNRTSDIHLDICPEFCKKYTAKDTIIFIFQRQNFGPSSREYKLFTGINQTTNVNN